MKRVLSLVLVLLIILGTTMPAFAETATSLVSEETMDLARFGIISGNGDGYNEDGVLTRAQFTVILSQLYGLKVAAESYSLESSYSDLVEGEWYVPYVAYSESKGWMLGMGDGTFAPTQPMTSQQVNAMYVKALGYNVSWDQVNGKAKELGVSVVASNSNAVLRIEAFKALRLALDVIPNGSTNTLGTTLPLVGYKSSIIGVPIVDIPTGTLGVASIKALNLKQIEIVYNSVIDDAGDESNYSVDTEGTALINSLSDFDLQEDGKTVIITLTNAAKQQEILDFTIKDISDVYTTVKVEFIDLKVPTVLSAEGVGMHTVKVNFSEPMFTDLTTKTNYSAVDANGSKIYVKEVTPGTNNMYVLVEFYSELKGQEVITIKDMKDYQGYKILSVEKLVNTEIDIEAPVVVSYKNADQNSVTLVFDNDIEINNATLSNYYHTNTTSIASEISVEDNEMTIEFSSQMHAGTAFVYIEKESIKDLWGNKNSKISEAIEITIDNIAPKVVGDIKVTSQSTIEVEFDEAVIDTGDSFKVTLLDKNGDEPNIKTVVDIDNETIEFVFSEDLYGDYTIAIDGVEDKNENAASDFIFDFSVVDETAPDISGFVATIYDSTTQLIVVDFKEKMDAEGILDKVIYFYGTKSLDDNAVTTKLINDGKAVEISVPTSYVDMVSGQDLTIGRVSDAAGNLMNAIYAELELVDGEDMKIEVKSVELINNKTVVLTVDGDELAGIEENRFAFNSGVTIDRIVLGFNSDDESVLTFTLDDIVGTNETITLTISEGAGENIYGQTLATGNFIAKDSALPVVNKFDYINATTIVIEFSEALNSDTFSLAGNNGFSVSGGNAELTSVSYSASKLTLVGTDFTADTNVYYNSLFGISDTSGNNLESFSRTSNLD